MSGGDMSSGGQGGREVIPVVPQAMSREGSISLHYPMLNKSNYSAWCIKMEVYMEAQGVWEAVESEEPVETRKDKMALAAIYQGISEETLLRLGAKKTAKEAWKALKTMHLGAGRVKEVRAQALRWELEGLRMGDHETIDDFTGKIIVNVNHLRSLGEEVSEAYVVKKILRAVSPKFLQIASTIEEFGDLENKTIEEVVGSLKAHEERMRGHEDRREEHVLLARTDWKPRSRSNHGENYGSRDHSYDDGRERSGRRQPNDRNKQWFDISKIKCYACNEYGHFASNCRTENTRREEAHLVEDDVEEPALLMMEESEMSLSCESTEEPKQQDDFQTRDAEKSESLSKANEILVDIRQSEDHVGCETEKLKALKSETSELSRLKMKLEEELDDLRAQKLELLAEADRLKVEKTKCEMFLSCGKLLEVKPESEFDRLAMNMEPVKVDSGNCEKKILDASEETEEQRKEMAVEKRKQKESAKIKQHQLEEIAKAKELKSEIEVELVKSKEQLTDLMPQALTRCKMKELRKLDDKSEGATGLRRSVGF